MAPLEVQTMGREEWLQARREVLTATDIARLYTGGPAEWEAVRADKTGTRPPVSSPYFDWGHEREEELIEFARDMDVPVHPNESLFVDGEFGATPDGVSADGKTLVECKTTGSFWSPDDIPVRYRVQVEWQLMVMGADRCLLVWEERLGAPPMFFPGAVDYAWITPDMELRRELVDIAHRFQHGEDSPNDEFPALLSEYAERKAARDAAEEALKEVEGRIREAAGDGEFTYSSAAGKVSLSLPKPRRSFDQKRFAAEHAEMAQQYMVERPASKPTLRITLPKREATHG